MSDQNKNQLKPEYMTVQEALEAEYKFCENIDENQRYKIGHYGKPKAK